MARKKPWDKHEAAILLDAVIKIDSGEVERKQAISDVSNKLRKMAERAGYEIDDVYRNIAGITFQMYSMESAYAGYTKVKPASKLFLEVVKIRNEQKDEYAVLLREAMDLIGTIDSQGENINKVDMQHSSNDGRIEFNMQDVRDYIVDSEKRRKEFSEWIIENGKAASTARQYVSALGTVSDIAKNSGIIQKDIYEIDDVDDIKEIIVKLMETPEFVDKNTTGHNRLSAVLTKYVQFSGDMSFDYKSTRARRGKKESVTKKREYKDLYMRLKSMAKVYDDVKGFPIEWIHEKLGVVIGIEKLEKSLADIPWVTEVKENVYSFSSKAEIQVEFDKDAFVEVLMQRYQHGMKMDSIDLEIFRDTYKDVTGNEIQFSDKELIICLRNSGVIYKDRVFPADGIINNDAKEKLIEYITENFENGKKVLYYKSIYDDLKDVFAYCFNLTDAMMLKPYLEFICDSSDYYFSDEFISKEKDVKLNHSDEIEEFLISAGMPLSYEDIYSGLSHIAREIVHDEIKSNPNILLNGRENYFHYGIFEFSSEDADRITEYINDNVT